MDLNAIITLIITILTLVGYPIAGLIEALRLGEKVRMVELLKTIIINLGTLGAFNLVTQNIILELVGTAGFGIIIDKLINASTRKTENL